MWRISIACRPCPTRRIRSTNPAAEPGDIAVGSMTPRGTTVRTRVFAAREREYRYYIEPRKNRFTRARRGSIRAAGCRADERGGGVVGIRRFYVVRQAQFEQQDQHLPRHARGMDGRRTGVLLLFIRADRFPAQHGEGSLVGTLVDVGRGRYTPDSSSARSSKAATCRGRAKRCPAQGFLSDGSIRRVFSNGRYLLNFNKYYRL